MKVSEVRAIYSDQAEKGSNVARQLALGGIAVLWLFRSDGHAVALPWLLYIAALAFIFALGADLAQYFFGTKAWFKEADATKQEPADADHKVSVKTNRPLQALHSWKLLAAGFGGAVLVAFLIGSVATDTPTSVAPPTPCVCNCLAKP